MDYRSLWVFVILTIAGLGCGEVFEPASPSDCAIPDGAVTNTFAQCTSQTINIPKSGIITAIRFGFQITHPYVSDVLVALLPPGKTQSSIN
jgi:subtilisin-like proprotein convertase family protein